MGVFCSRLLGSLLRFNVKKEGFFCRTARNWRSWRCRKIVSIRFFLSGVTCNAVHFSSYFWVLVLLKETSGDLSFCSLKTKLKNTFILQRGRYWSCLPWWKEHKAKCPEEKLAMKSCEPMLVHSSSCNCWEGLDCSLKWLLQEFQKHCLLIPPSCCGILNSSQFQLAVLGCMFHSSPCQWFAAWCFVLPLQSGAAEKVYTC